LGPLSEYELVETSDLWLELPLDYLLAVSWEDTSDLESEHTLVDSLVISSDNTLVGSLDLSLDCKSVVWLAFSLASTMERSS
jgi:hypothetical protein